MLSLLVLVLGSLFVSFRPSSLRSHSCSTSACLPLSPSAFSLSFRFLSSPSVPVLTTQPSVLPFRSSRFRLTVASPVRLSAFASWLSPFFPAWFPMLSFPVLVLSFLFVSFRPSLIRFPQLFLRCFPYALALGIFRFPSGFFRPLQFRFRLLSLCFFLSALPGSASQWLPRCAASTHASTVFPVRPGLVSHALLPVLILGFLFVSFRPFSLRSHSCSTSASLLFRFLSSASLPGFPLMSAPFRSLTLGSDYSAFRTFLSPLPDLP